MRFINPELLPLLPLAVLVPAALIAFSYFRSRRALASYGDYKLLCHLSKPFPLWRHLARGVTGSLCAIYLIIALARPIVDEGTTTIKSGTVDVVTIVDVSRSMAALDYEGKVPLSAIAVPSDPESEVYHSDLDIEREAEFQKQKAGTRLEMVRHVLRDNLMKQLNGNQLGIVSYAGQAFPQAFLTGDMRSLDWIVNRGLTISSAPGEGSNVSSALDLALALFEADSAPGRTRIAILFSDGGSDDEAATLSKLSQEFRARGIKLIVVGLGNPVPSRIPVVKLARDDEVAEGLLHNGKEWYEVDGQVEKTGLNLNLLHEIATTSGGRLLHMRDADDLDLSAFTERSTLTEVKGKRELFPVMLLTSLCSMILFTIAARQWRQKS